MQPFTRWWSAQEFWRVDPVFSVLQLPADDPRRDELVPVALTSPNRDLVLAYLFTRSKATRVEGGRINLRLPNGSYRIEFFRPSDGSPLGEPRMEESPGLRRQFSVPLPDFADDLALRVVRTVTKGKTLIPGTR